MLKDLIKELGYSQTFVCQKLNERGVFVTRPHFNRWCNGHLSPKSPFVYSVIAEIMKTNLEEVTNCFNNKKSKSHGKRNH